MMLRAALLSAALLATATAATSNWTATIPWTMKSPAVSGDAVYVAGLTSASANGEGLTVMSLAASSGATIWSTNVSVPPGTVPPGAGADSVHVAAGPTGAVVAVGQSFAVWVDRGGAVRRRWKVNGATRRAHVTADGAFVVLASDSGISVFDVLTGQPLWSKTVPAVPGQPPHVATTVTAARRPIVALQAENTVHAFNLRSGAAVWSARPPLLVGDFRGRVSAAAGLFAVSAIREDPSSEYYITTAVVLSAETGQVYAAMKGSQSQDPGVRDSTLTANGKYLMLPAVGMDSVSFFFAVGNETLVETLLDGYYLGPCTSVAAHPDKVACSAMATDGYSVNLALAGPSNTYLTPCADCDDAPVPLLTAGRWIVMKWRVGVAVVRGYVYNA